MSETLTPKEFRVEGEQGFGGEFIECSAGSGRDLEGGRGCGEGDAASAWALKSRRPRLYQRASVAAAAARTPRPGDEALAVEIRQILDEEPTSGYRRVTFRLRRRHRVNRKRVQRLMRERGWRSLGYQGRRGRRRRLPVGRRIHAARPNERWGTDWTCFWAYDR